MKINTSRRNERGAVALFLAITLSTVLLITGALAVDLGNAWARGRDVQRQVDVAALAAAPHLPVTTVADRTAAAQAVLDSMKLSNNAVSGQNLSSVTADQLINSGQFKPELLNRFDEIVLFRPLKPDELAQVVQLMLDGINRTLANQNITVQR